MDTIAHLLNPLLMILMPLFLGVVLARRLGVSWGLFLIGAVAFIGSQVFHIPFNSWVLLPVLQKLEPAISQRVFILISAVALGLSAGVFEETARYLAIRSRKESERTWSNSLMIGAGHGGAEAIILGFLVFYSFLQALALRNADLAVVLPADQIDTAEAGLLAYWSAPWYLSLLGALERASALCLQVFLTVVVLQVFVRTNFLWLGLAIGIHAFADAAGLLALQSWGPYWTEAVLLALALVSVGLTWKLRSPDPAPIALPLYEAPIPTAPRQIEELSYDQLEDSRYD